MLRILETGRRFFSRRVALLQDPASIRRLIDRERARTFRTGVEFSIILFRAKRTRHVVLSTYRLAKVILTRARATDEVGWFDDDHLCLLLPDTGNSGAWRVAADIRALLSGKLPRPLFAVYTYSATGLRAGAVEQEPARAREPASGRADVAAVAHEQADRRARDDRQGPDDHDGDGGFEGGNGHGGNGHQVDAHDANRHHGNDNDGNGRNGNGRDGDDRGGNGPDGSGNGRGKAGEGSDVPVCLPAAPPPQPPAFRATDLLPRLLEGAKSELVEGAPPAARAEELLVRRLPPWKRAVDIFGAALGLIVAAPLLLMIAAAIKLTSRGPVIFRQRRAGLGGTPFHIYKFRTMVVDAERAKRELRPRSEQDGPAFKMKSDPRVTCIGKLLRITSLDELPQFWNVLVGDMSLVGPRPLPMEESDACEAWHRVRLDVTPGITCIWQVQGRSRVTFTQWMRMDMGYIRRRNFWTDLKILMATVPAVLLRRGAQ